MLRKTGKTTTILVLLFLFQFHISIIAQQNASVLAVISDVKGNVFLKKTLKAETLKAVFGMQLVQGDREPQDRNLR